MYGYHGRFLLIDVATGAADWQPLSEAVRRRFIGGVGLATWLLHQFAPVGVDPLAPAAPLVFCFSPLVGTPLTTSAKFAIAAKSPLTERCNDALSSSHFAIEGKKTGADAIVLVGASVKPVIVVIDDGRVRLLPATALWGRSTHEASAAIAQEFGASFQSAVIGPAGEACVRYATISHGSRHAGRGGLGAVLGAKKVKAVVVRGTQRCPVADPARVVAIARDLSQRSFGPATAKYRELGTVANLLTFNRLNLLPTRNFQEGTFAGAAELSGEALQADKHLTRESCAACTIGCEHIFSAPGGRVRLEYESLFALGPLCGISAREVVLEAARRCDELGLDTISTGATVAFAMECAERGLLDEPDLRFGRGDTLLGLLEPIARRTGLGALLAEGTRRAAATIGGVAPDFAPHVKGLEIPGYEPRALQSMALGFAVGTRGADHNRSGAYEVDFSPQNDRLHGTPESAVSAVATEDKAAVIDSLILCKFLRGVFSDLYAESAELLSSVTGWKVTAEELATTARRIVTAKKLFNIREGWTPAEDTLPPRFLTEDLPAGSAPGARLPRARLRMLIGAYNHTRGWDDRGYVPASQVEDLDLQGLAVTVPNGAT